VERSGPALSTRETPYSDPALACGWRLRMSTYLLSADAAMTEYDKKPARIGNTTGVNSIPRPEPNKNRIPKFPGSFVNKVLAEI